MTAQSHSEEVVELGFQPRPGQLPGGAPSQRMMLVTLQAVADKAPSVSLFQACHFTEEKTEAQGECLAQGRMKC